MGKVIPRWGIACEHAPTGARQEDRGEELEARGDPTVEGQKRGENNLPCHPHVNFCSPRRGPFISKRPSSPSHFVVEQGSEKAKQAQAQVDFV
jgi:hypothetical protein